MNDIRDTYRGCLVKEDDDRNVVILGMTAFKKQSSDSNGSTSARSAIFRALVIPLDKLQTTLLLQKLKRLDGTKALKLGDTRRTFLVTDRYG